MKRTMLALVLTVATPALAGAQVLQDFTLSCTDATFGFSYSVPTWGPAVCVPPTPYDVIGKPGVGWGATPACTTGGSFACTPGDTFDGMFPGSTGLGSADTSASATLVLSGVNNFIAGATLNAFIVPTAPFYAVEKEVQIQVDGGVQMNSAVAGSFAIADVFLYREVAGVFTLIATRRVMAQNAVAQQTIQPFSIAAVDKPVAGTIVSYRLASILVANNAPAFVGGNLSGSRIRIVGTQHIQ